MLKLSEETDLHHVVVETHDNLVYFHIVESEPDGYPWYHDIKTFLKEGKYPESPEIKEP